MQCEASFTGYCDGLVDEYDVMWQCRPRMKDLAKGHTAYDTIIKVAICEEHSIALADIHDCRMPVVPGWDKTDAMDNLCCYLPWKPIVWPEMDSEPEEKFNADYVPSWKKPKDDVCRYATFNNNELHSALLTYVNGFTFGGFAYHCCDDCYLKEPSWRDEGAVYSAGLAPEDGIIDMVTANPKMAMERNAFKKSPLELIDFLIEELKESTAEYSQYSEYVRYHEDGTARMNIRTLTRIKKEIMEVMDVYAN